MKSLYASWLRGTHIHLRPAARGAEGSGSLSFCLSPLSAPGIPEAKREVKLPDWGWLGWGVEGKQGSRRRYCVKGSFLAAQQTCLRGRQGEETRRWPRAGPRSWKRQWGPQQQRHSWEGASQEKMSTCSLQPPLPKRSSTNGFRAGPENGRSKLQAMSEDTKPFPLQLAIRGLQLKLQDLIIQQNCVY